MENKRISQLGIKSILNGSECFPSQDGVSNYKITADSISNYAKSKFSLSDIVGIILSVCPRHVFWVYGGSTDGGTTPDSATQISINALLNAGVPQENIWWLYEDTSTTNIFTISSLLSNTTLDNTILSLAGGNLSVEDLYINASIDEVTLIDPNNLIFITENLTSLTSFDDVAIILAGGNLVVSDLLSATLFDNITLSQSVSYIFNEEFNSGLGQFIATNGSPQTINGQLQLNNGDIVRANIPEITQGKFIEIAYTVPAHQGDPEDYQLMVYLHATETPNLVSDFNIYIQQGANEGEYSIIGGTGMGIINTTYKTTEQVLRIENRSDGSVVVFIDGVQRLSKSGVNLGNKPYLSIREFEPNVGPELIKINNVKVGTI